MTATDSGSVLAAGLLEAAGALDDALTATTATAAARRAARRLDPLAPGRPRSRPPDTVEGATPAARRRVVRSRCCAGRVGWARALSTAWSEALVRSPLVPADRPLLASPIVRLTVRSLDDAERLARDRFHRTGTRGAADRQAGPSFLVALAAPRRCHGRPRGAEWQTQMTNSSHAGTLYDVGVVEARRRARPGHPRRRRHR